MEKFMQRENGFMGYAHHQGFSPKTSHGDSSEEMDFNDIFGGPPRRYSTQEARLRYSFGETEESEEEIASSPSPSPSPWGLLNGKPVFGEESVPRRRHNHGDDFFDDIFRGDESSYNSPRRTDNIYGSTPGSRIMSPAKPLPPKAEPFGTQFSLPAKMTKASEFPTFSTNNYGQYKMDAGTNGLNGSLSRFSSQATRSQDEIRPEVHSVYRQSPLSRDTSFRCEDAPSTMIFDQKDSIETTRKDRRNVDSSSNQFHFSIYKWAGRGVPILMPLAGGSNTKTKDSSKCDRSASSNGRIESKLSTLRHQGLPATVPESLKIEPKKEDLSEEETEELQDSIDQESLHEIPELNSQNSRHNMVVSGETRQDIKEEQVKPLHEIDIQEKTEDKVPLKKAESIRSEVKPLHALLSDEETLKKEESLWSDIKPLHALLRDEAEDKNEEPGKVTEMKENKKRTPNGVHTISHDSKNVKKNDGMGIHTDDKIVDKSGSKGAALNSEATPAVSAVKGKVKEFVQIFNQEADSKPKADLQRRSQSTRWRSVGIDRKENEVSPNAAKVKEKVNLHVVDKNSEVSVKVDGKLNKDESQCSPTKATSHTSNQPFTNLKNAFSSDMFHWDSKIYVDYSDDPLEEDFLVQELYDHHEQVTQNEGSEDTKAIDAKIRQWSVGKKGNIRSLLSTLQYVLWPGSGWKPVPLVDLIEANAVKRAYQKALLRLHPDKLQQKGAAFHLKYTAEKVFDILQEAWDHFNAVTPL